MKKTISGIVIIGIAFCLISGPGFAAAQGIASAPGPQPADGPALTWNTFLGGLIESHGHDLVLDANKNVYVAGISNHTWGSPIRAYSGANFDAFVAKLSPSGALIWNTFLGGDGDDMCHSIALDASGNIYVAGTANLAWGSPVRAYQGGMADVWAARLDTNGNLQWNTFLGSETNDTPAAISVDGYGNIYVTGGSESTWGSPIHPFIFYDGFLARLNGAGGLVWNTFFGSGDLDVAWDVATDGSGGVFVTGWSDSGWGIPIQPFMGETDGFLAKFGGNGAMAWNTFLGSTNNTVFAWSVATDSKGDIYVAGLSNTSWGSPVNPFGGGSMDAFAAKLGAGGGLLWNSFLGGADMDMAESVAVDGSGNVYVGGYSYMGWGSPSLPFQGWDGLDIFAAKLDAGGALAWNAFVPSTDWAVNWWGMGIAADGAGGVFIAGTSENSFGTPIRAFSGLYDAYAVKLGEAPAWLEHHAVGDFDGDGADELAVDLGTTGLWLYNAGSWSQLSALNPESLTAADVDGDGDGEILADLGSSGLWLWNAGAWGQLSGVNVEGLAAGDIDADGADEVVGDFGTAGLWLNNGGSWSQLSGVNVDQVIAANVNGTGGAEIIGDFGATGLWLWSGGWTQLSGVNADQLTSGEWTGGEYLVGDFATLGLWDWTSGAWRQLSGVNATGIMTADLDGSGEDDLVGAFGLTGLWSFDGLSWTQLSGLAAEYMIKADADGDGDYAIVGDFGTTGLWLADGGAWTQLSGVNAENMVAGDFDNDGRQEVAADFGALGLWLWNEGAWTQISGLDPE